MYTGQTRGSLIHEFHPLRRGWFVALFLVVILALLSVRPTVAQSEGHWKLVNVSNSGTKTTGLIDYDNAISGIDVDKLDVFSSNGSVSIGLIGDERGRDIDIAGTSQWTPPPVAALPGQQWVTGRSGTIDRNPRGFELSAMPLVGEEGGNDLRFDDTRSTYEFPVPEGRPRKLTLMATGALYCRYPYIHIWDTYSYEYEWVGGEPRTANEPPSVTLVMTPTNPTIHDTIRFNAQATDPDGDTLSYIWFVNDQRQSSTKSDVRFKQPKEGWYSLRVVVDDGRGGLAEDQVIFMVGTPVEMTIRHEPSLDLPLQYVITLNHEDAQGKLQPFADKALTVHAFNIDHNWAKLKDQFWLDARGIPVIQDIEEPLTVTTKEDGTVRLTFFPDFAKILAHEGSPGVHLPAWNRPLEVRIRVEYVVEHPDRPEYKEILAVDEVTARLDYMAYVTSIAVRAPDVVTSAQEKRYEGDFMSLREYELLDPYNERWSTGASRVQVQRAGFSSIAAPDSGRWGEPLRRGDTVGAGDAVLIDARSLTVLRPRALDGEYRHVGISPITSGGIYVGSGHIQLYIKYVDQFQAAVRIAEPNSRFVSAFEMSIGNPDDQFDDYAFIRWMTRQLADKGIEYALTTYTLPVIGQAYNVYSTLGTLADVAKFGDTTYIRMLNTAYYARMDEDGTLSVSTRKGEVGIANVQTGMVEQTAPTGQTAIVSPAGDIRVVATEPDAAQSADRLIEQMTTQEQEPQDTLAPSPSVAPPDASEQPSGAQVAQPTLTPTPRGVALDESPPVDDPPRSQPPSPPPSSGTTDDDVVLIFWVVLLGMVVVAGAAVGGGAILLLRRRRRATSGRANAGQHALQPAQPREVWPSEDNVPQAVETPLPCARCGRPFRDEDRFCASCGAPRETPAPPTPVHDEPTMPPPPSAIAPHPPASSPGPDAEAEPRRRNSALKWIIGAIVAAMLLCAAVSGVLLFLDRGERPVFETRPTFTDDFTDPNSGWRVGAIGESSSQYADGRLLLTLAVPNQLGYCLLDGRQFRDLAMEIDAVFNERPAGSSYGIAARYRDSGHLLLFEVSNEGMVRVLRKAESWTVLQDWTPASSVRTGQAPNQLRLYVSGPTLVFSINGQTAYAGVDSGDFDLGQIALAVRSGPDPQRVRVSFDNLKIWEIK